jgi:hypothetical protein
MVEEARMSMTGANLTKLLQIIPTLAAAISFVVLSLAFVHEWAFYYVIGGQFQQLVGITDYFNSAIGWLPWAALGLCTGAVLNLSSRTRDVSPDEKEKFYRAHRIRWVVDNVPKWFIFTTLVAAGAFQFLFGDWYVRGALQFFFMFLWIVLLKSLASQDTIASVVTKELVYVLAFGPMLLCFAYVGGMTEAAETLSQKESSFIGRLKNQYQERDWVVLRALANGLIVRDLAGSRIEYLKWDDVAVFSSKVPQPNRSGLVCRLGGYLCR